MPHSGLSRDDVLITAHGSNWNLNDGLFGIRIRDLHMGSTDKQSILDQVDEFLNRFEFERKGDQVWETNTSAAVACSVVFSLQKAILSTQGRLELYCGSPDVTGDGPTKSFRLCDANSPGQLDPSSVGLARGSGVIPPE